MKTSKHLRLEAMALEIPEVPGHPNRIPFRGVLTVLDRPSDRAPSGAAGHRVVLPRDVAERALPSLLGMAVDIAAGLRGHDTRQKVGVITSAEIRGDRLEVAGYLFGKDFPEAIRELRARRDRLGMSYEVTGVRVRDPQAQVWVLETVVFTGAAILERAAAAYEQTSLAAQAARNGFESTGGTEMERKMNETLELLAQASQTLAAEFSSLKAMVEELRRTQEAVRELMEGRGAAGESIETRVGTLEERAAETRRQEDALRAQSERTRNEVRRKTVPAHVLTLLAKGGMGAGAFDAGGTVEMAALDKALEGLAVEQRIAVKSQLARAGAIE